MPRGIYPTNRGKLKVNGFKKGHQASESVREKISQTLKSKPKGDKHPNWKDKVTYSGIHKWMQREFGRPKQCEKCSKAKKNTYAIHWANISGDYKREREDWMRLCANCHYHLDRG